MVNSNNTLATHLKEFQSWWDSRGKGKLPLIREEARSGWLECMLEKHKITGIAYKLRGCDSYCTGWNAAVDFLHNNRGE